MEADRKNAEIKWQRLLISIPVPTRWPLCPYMETYPARPASDGKKVRAEIVKLFIRFRPLILRYSWRATRSAQMREFGGFFKPLIISRLNFIDRY